MMTCGDIVVKIHKIGNFGFSIFFYKKSDKFEYKSYCLTKMSQGLYHSIDNSCSYMTKPQETNFHRKKLKTNQNTTPTDRSYFQYQA